MHSATNYWVVKCGEFEGASIPFERLIMFGMHRICDRYMGTGMRLGVSWSDSAAMLDALDAVQLRDLAKRLLAEMCVKQVMIDKLTHEMAVLKRLKFAAQSEAFHAGQKSLLDETIDTDLESLSQEIERLAPPWTEEREKKQPRAPLPAHLPRKEIRHGPESTTCRYGCQLQRIGEDIAEKLDYQPGVFMVERHARSKWACPHCQTLVQGPVTPHIIDKDIPITGLLAQVLAAKYSDHRVLRTRPSKLRWKRCFTKDEGWPLEVGLQEQVSNRHKLRELRAVVVSVAGNGGARLRQVRFKGTNASEPLMTCRKVYNRRRNREGVVGPGQGWGKPDYRPTGVRHEGGVTLIQALVRNVGTCRPDVKGEAQVDNLRKKQSTGARHRDGVARSVN